MKSTWNNRQGSRDRQAVAVLVTADGAVHQFTGESIPGVCYSQITGRDKDGKWSSTTFSVEHHDTTVLVSWKQDWDTGRSWPQSDWSAALAWLQIHAPAATLAGLRACLEAGGEQYAKTIARLDAQSAAVEAFK